MLLFLSEQSACVMCRQPQWPLLTLSSLSSSPVFTFLPEGLYLGFWFFAFTLIFTQKDEKCKKINICFGGSTFWWVKKKFVLKNFGLNKFLEQKWSGQKFVGTIILGFRQCLGNKNCWGKAYIGTTFCGGPQFFQYFYCGQNQKTGQLLWKFFPL